jgi:hypothetical protein
MNILLTGEVRDIKKRLEPGGDVSISIKNGDVRTIFLCINTDPIIELFEKKLKSTENNRVQIQIIINE